MVHIWISPSGFHVSLYSSNDTRLKIRVTCIFLITQDGISISVLEEIILFFEGGHLQRDKRNDTYNLRINTLKLILRDPHLQWGGPHLQWG
jgi:hypothetical protein